MTGQSPWDLFVMTRAKHPYQFCQIQNPEIWDGSAWMSIIATTCEQIDALLSEGDSEHFAWTQIKEKYGGLRMYFKGQVKRVDIFTPTRLYSYWEPNIQPMTHWTQLVHPLTVAAEKQSRTMCYVCGSPGTLRTHLPRFLTVCQAHGDWNGS